MDYTPDFRNTLDLIYSFTMNGRKQRKNKDGVPEPTLDVMVRLMAYLHHPEKSYPVIHIAGTKGKGSTANFIANSLVQAGYKVGLYTSPHLQDFSERIRVNGKIIPHDEVTSSMERMKPFYETHPEVNTFEIITAIAFDYFKQERVDIAVVEVGLGGRFDATNVVEPILSIITSISFDHMDLLGDTLQEIAFEKAGIIKPGVAVITGKQNSEAFQVLQEIAIERNSPFIDAYKSFEVKAVETSLAGHSFTLKGQCHDQVSLMIPLLGMHQIENAVLSYASLIHCRELGLNISDEAINKGFSSVDWPARFEILSTNPLVVIDGAHNVDSIRRLLESVALLFPDKELHFLVGISHGKDIEGMLKEILPACATCLFTRSTHPKAIDPQGLVQLSNHLGYETDCEFTVEKALEKSINRLPDKALLVCTGSLFVAAAARSIWMSKKHET